MSAGSLAEVETQALIAQRLGFITQADAAKPLTVIHSLKRQLQALRKALVRKQESPCSTFPVPRSPL